MGHNKRISCKMKIFTNIIAFIAMTIQIISFFLNALGMSRPQDTAQELYDYFIFAAYVCSIATVIIFFILYNSNVRIKGRKTAIVIICIVTILGAFIHASQLAQQKSFTLTSIVLLAYDCYIMKKIL